MSGGSHDYIYSSLASALDIPSGGYGIGTEGRYGTYFEDSKFSREKDPMHDSELSEMMYDVDCLLHSLEWYESSDIGEEKYYEDVKAFKEKWFGRDCETSFAAYRQDLINRLEAQIQSLRGAKDDGGESEKQT